MKKVVALVLALVLALTCSACDLSDLLDVRKAKEKVFTNNGAEITLTEGFWKSEYEGYAFCYDSVSVAVFGLKEEFTILEGFEDYTVEQYADLVYRANEDQSPDPVKNEDGLVIMEYTVEGEGEEASYSYFSVMYKGTDAFWTIQFACEVSLYEEYRPSFVAWAKTVKV